MKSCVGGACINQLPKSTHEKKGGWASYYTTNKRSYYNAKSTLAHWLFTRELRIMAKGI